MRSHEGVEIKWGVFYAVSALHLYLPPPLTFVCFVLQY